MAEQAKTKHKVSAKGIDKGFVLTLALTFAAVALIFTAFYMISNSGGLPLIPLNRDGKDDYGDAPALESIILKETEDAGEEYISDTLFIGDGNFLRFVRSGILTYNNVIGLEGKGIRDAASEPEVFFSG